ncbi:MAG TPA: hypothetical protein VFR11_16105 [Micromonosporaceae bacterium]|nr:hypothetical protein [Micromonosporaceae bacterium]
MRNGLTWRNALTWQRLLTWLRRVGPYVAAFVVAIAAIVGLMERPSTVSTTHRADYVIIAGAAGLRWDDVNASDTPTLWRLAQHDAIAALTVRSAHSPTCPNDGWLTLGAGNYALRSVTTARGQCPPVSAPISSPDGIGASVGDQAAVNGYNHALSYGAEPGALAEAVRCTVAVGTGAAIAAARPFGRVDRYVKTMPADPTNLLRDCTLSIVDVGTVSGPTPDARAVQARAVDANLARLLAARPAHSLVLIAGLSDTDPSSRLHVAIADGAGFTGGWLTSTSTGRAGYLQVVDLAPTVLAALGRPEPTKLFVGSQAQSVGGRPTDPTSAIARLADADHQAAVRQGVADWFFGLYAVGVTLLLIVAVPLLRRARRSAEPHGPPPISRRTVHAIELLLVTAGVSIPAAVLSDTVPWWRFSRPGLAFALVGAVFAAAVTMLVWLAGRRRGALGLLGGAAVVSAGVIGIDVITGSHLQLNGVVGYSAAAGGRYAGMGPAGLGAFIAGVLLSAACAAQYVPPRRWRPAVVAAIVGIGVIIVGSPYLGADAGGALALTAAGCLAAAIAGGGWVTFARLAWAALAGLVVLVGFAVLDLRRPVEDRSSVGRFIAQFHAGTAGSSVHLTGVNDVVTSASNAISVLVLVAIAYNLAVLLRPWGGLMRLFGLYPAVRGALTGVAVASVLAGIIDGVGLTTAGGAAAVTLPLVTLAALQVLDHADDRTQGEVPLPEAKPRPTVDIREPEPAS